MKKFFKILGYILLGLLVLLIALAIILPKKIDVQVSKEIATAPQYLYNILKDPSLTTEYNAWVLQDPKMEVTPSGDQGIGSGYSWSSPDGSSGRSVISNATANQLVAMNVFIGNEEEPMTTTYQLSPQADGSTTNVTVDWQVDLGFPKNIMGPVLSYQGKKQFKNTLNNLATLAKKRSQDNTYHGYLIKRVEAKPQSYIVKRDKVSTAAQQQFYSQALSSVFRALQEGEVNVSGAECALIYQFDDINQQVDIAAALPVAEDVEIANAITVMLAQAPAVTTDYYGNRANARSAHDAISDYLADRNLSADVPYVEEYITDVLEEKDPSKWLTRITYRIATK